MKDGIPIIRQGDYYHELLPKQDMHHLLQRSRLVGWETALAETIKAAPESKRRVLRTIMLDEGRAAFKVLLAPLAGKRVLDLGCGSGSTALNIARWAGEVVGCDLTWERVAFLSVRAKALGLLNVRSVCGGDTRPLPFADHSFDCIVLNGVLEWSAGDGNEPVRDLQLEFLREAKRMLRPSGQIYIGIENRIGFNYFLGQPEDHTGVRYAALLPRPIANAWVKLNGGRAYRTYTYSWAGYKALLREAGLDNVSFYAPIPDYRDFQEIIPLDSKLAVHESAGGWRARLRSRLFRSKWLTPSFGIVTSPAFATQSLIVQLATEVRRRLNFPYSNEHPTIRLTGASSAGLVIGLDNAAILRVPLDPANEIRVSRNFDGLTRAQAIADSTGAPFIAPQPLVRDTFCGVHYTVEGYLEGRSHKSFSPTEYAVAAHAAFQLLVTWKSHAVGVRTQPNRFKDWISEQLQVLFAAVQDREHRRRLERLSEVANELDVDGIPAAAGHGDFWWGNLLFDFRATKVGLVDWDGWSDADAVTNDFLHFLCWRRLLRDRCTWGQALSDWLMARRVDSLERSWTKRFAEQVGLRTDWRKSAALLYWLKQTASHGPAKFRFDESWMQMVFNDGLSALLSAKQPSYATVIVTQAPETERC